MANPFVAEIRIYGFNFAPKGWAFCDGQLIPVAQNTALFSLLGTFYGGDGKTTFALPNLQGSVPVQAGQGSGLSQYFLGQDGGAESITLLQSEMPIHTHTMQASGSPANQPGPNPTNSLARTQASAKPYVAAAHLVNMNLQALAVAGGSLPHNNMMPYLTLNFCIALQGVFPQRP
jgi:microcystin-dependent protein